MMRPCSDTTIASRRRTSTEALLHGGTESRAGTRSLVRGPEPALRPHCSDADEDAAAVRQILAWLLDGGFEPGDIGVFARGRSRVEKLARRLEAEGVPVWPLRDRDRRDEREGIQLGTMHRAKGLEFKAVLVLGCSKRALPSHFAVRGTDDPAAREEAIARERRLLYVAMTRARDELVVSWAGKPSPFLERLLAPPTAN